MNREIIHLDMDAFFASIEQLRHPELRGKPLIVGGHPKRRGVVSTCSYEARKFGIHSGMPTRTAMRLCPEEDILGLSISLPGLIDHNNLTILHSAETGWNNVCLYNFFADRFGENVFLERINSL